MLLKPVDGSCTGTVSDVSAKEYVTDSQFFHSQLQELADTLVQISVL